MNRQFTKLEVVFAGEKWDVREGGIGRLTSHADQVGAAAAARAVAIMHPPCELIVRNSDGSIASQESFRPPTK